MGGGPRPITSPQTLPSKDASPQSSIQETNVHRETPNLGLGKYSIFVFVLSFLFINPLACLPVILKDLKLPFDSRIDPEFEIQSISVHYSYDTATWDITKTRLDVHFKSINPSNHREVVFDNIVISVYHDGELFMVGIWPPFCHKAGEKTLVDQTVVHSMVLESSAVGGRGKFSAKIDARMKYAPRTFWEKIVPVTARFEDVRVEFPQC